MLTPTQYQCCTRECSTGLGRDAKEISGMNECISALRAFWVQTPTKSIHPRYKSIKICQKSINPSKIQNPNTFCLATSLSAYTYLNSDVWVGNFLCMLLVPID